MKLPNLIQALLKGTTPESCIDMRERVVFFPTAGCLRGECWRIPIHGWIYQPTEYSRLRRSALWVANRVLRYRIPEDHPGMPLFQQRAAAFLANNERGNRVKIRVGEAVFTLKNSRASGHFEGRLELPAERVCEMMTMPEAQRLNRGAPAWLSFSAITRSDDPRLFDGRALLVPPTGVSIISDIDDTIKVTEAFNRRRMLHNTFLKDFSSVPEMAPLYGRWEAQRCAAFHYVSASPWHLFPFLAEFLGAQAFPAGTFHLRDFRLMPPDLHRTLRPSKRIKAQHIRLLLKQFPQRRFYLVGDSGESDPATYATLARQFPGQIEKILIRNVTGEPADGPRWKRTFARVAKRRWQVFDSPAEIAII
jgi:Uncharacterized conserved protein (DUF2183)